MSRTRPPKAVRSILYIHWKLRYYPSNNPMNFLATNVTKKLDHNKLFWKRKVGVCGDTATEGKKNRAPHKAWKKTPVLEKEFTTSLWRAKHTIFLIPTQLLYPQLRLLFYGRLLVENWLTEMLENWEITDTVLPHRQLCARSHRSLI